VGNTLLEDVAVEGAGLEGGLGVCTCNEALGLRCRMGRTQDSFSLQLALF
jgi:hypothetical protein